MDVQPTATLPGIFRTSLSMYLVLLGIRVIIEEFCRICELYYNSTGDAKKDAGLRLMRQIKLVGRADGMCPYPVFLSGKVPELAGDDGLADKAGQSSLL